MASASQSGISPGAFRRIALLFSGEADTISHNGMVLALLASTGMADKASCPGTAVASFIIPSVTTAPCSPFGIC